MKKPTIFSRLMGILFISFFVSTLATFLSCDDDKVKQPVVKEPTQTLLMYMPWSSNLTSFFKINIADMSDAIADGLLEHERVLVFFASSATEASLFELTYKASDGTCEQKELKVYQNHDCTTIDGIATILNDVKQFAPADTYSMTIGGHGTGWLPVQSSERASSFKASLSASTAPLYHWEVEGDYLTRFIGGTSAKYQTEIATLAQAIKQADVVMEYILFDNCYMSNIEVAYDFRHVTRHVIASTSELMAYGMPYYMMAGSMLGDVDYEGISQSFYEFYSDYSMPCGTIAMTVTSELDSLATLMHEINTHFTWDSKLNSSVQGLDGYSPHVFYDLGDYVSNLCTDSLMLARFNEQLERAVPVASRRHTPTFYSALNNAKAKIYHFSGLTISDPSTHHLVERKAETNWYKATH